MKDKRKWALKYDLNMITAEFVCFNHVLFTRGIKTSELFNPWIFPGNDKSIHLNQSCCGSRGYDKRTHQCRNGYQVVKKPNPIKKNARHGICRACIRNMSDIREQIKMETLSVCKKYSKFRVRQIMHYQH